MITHYDLFAGIGGFSLALEEVFNDEPIRHVFCEWEQFPTAVLKQHWPDGEFWGDIKELVAGTANEHVRASINRGDAGNFTIVTGGFPCQPFSHAGRRKGTADDRYQWPNMFAVIRNTQPEWVIAENVRGLVTWNDGLVLETVCTDLESEGYEVQPFIIPAVAVGAPHRRDRVWIIAHKESASTSNTEYNGITRTEEVREYSGAQPENEAWSLISQYELTRASSLREKKLRRNASYYHNTTTDTRPQRRSAGSGKGVQSSREKPERENHEHPDWSRNWQEVAFATCDDAVDDGLSRLVDGVPYSRSKWRKDSLKAYGNGIVHQVATQIMVGIYESEKR